MGSERLECDCCDETEFSNSRTDEADRTERIYRMALSVSERFSWSTTAFTDVAAFCVTTVTYAEESLPIKVGGDDRRKK